MTSNHPVTIQEYNQQAAEVAAQYWDTMPVLREAAETMGMSKVEYITRYVQMYGMPVIITSSTTTAIEYHPEASK